MKQFLKYAKPHLLYFILGPLMILCEPAADILLPSMVADLINVGAANHNTDYIFSKALMMVGVAAVSFIGGVLGTILTNRAATHFAADIRKDTFNKIQTFSFGNLDKISTGSLITRLTNDVTQIQQFTQQIIRMGIRVPAQFLGAFIMAFKLNSTMAFTILGVVPVLAIIITVIIRYAMPRFQWMQTRIDRVNLLLQESMTSVRVIKAFVREDWETVKFETANTDLRDAAIKANRIMMLQRPIMTIAMNLTTLVIVWIGGNMIIAGSMPLGNLTAFITYVTQVLGSLNMLSNILVTSSRAIVSSGRVAEVLNARVDLNDDLSTQKDRLVKDGSIEFKNVTFRYYKNSPSPVLNNISFTINPGETVGIIGPTGSGKTTLVQMIPRLYDPDKGEILVDGVNVREYSLTNLRNGVGMVLQNNLLFSGTIAENLSWGNEHATEEQLDAAARYAQASLFIDSFEDRYDTELGQGGVNLSGGQKQRLCIARALLKEPKILILDDSSSAVDTATEAKIRQYFAENLPDTTKIIIAQRVTSVMESDKILVMDHGDLLDMGPHEELLKRCVAYREIYESQTRKEATA